MALIVRKAHSNRGLDNSEDEYGVKHSLLELRLTPSKGLGLFAKQKIQCGTRILSEAPLVITTAADGKLPPRLWEQLDKLSPAQRDQYDSLQSNRTLQSPKTASYARNAVVASGKLRTCPRLIERFIEVEMERRGIFRTNAVSLGPKQGYAVFALNSRINHSCTPNVYASYNHSLESHTVHAIRNIAAGEELLTSYINPAQPIEQRCDDLEPYGVDCYCSVCKKSAVAVRSEKNRDRLYDITRGLKAYDGKLDRNERVPPGLIPHNPKEALALAEQSVDLLKTESLLGMPLASAYRLCSKFSMQLGMVEKAKMYASRELEVERYCLGMETEWLDGGNARAWLKQVAWTAERDQVKIRMCEKRELKEAKKAEKKQAKKLKGGGGKR